MAAVGPRRVLWSRWVLVGALVTLVVGAPNLIYQATNGWPQLAMGRALADNNAASVHIVMWPFLLVMLGPPLVPVWIAGLVALWRDRAVRFLAVAFPVLLVLVFVMGAQFYYPFGLLAVMFAAGCVPSWRWVSARVGVAAAARRRRGAERDGQPAHRRCRWCRWACCTTRRSRR